MNGGNTLMVPVGAAYLMIAGIIGTVAAGGFYMGSLQRQIETHTEHLHEIDRQEETLKKELAESLKPVRAEIAAALAAQRQDMTERREMSDRAAAQMQTTLQNVDTRLTRFEAQIGYVATQVQALQATTNSFVAGPPRR